jgi:hypothetical protein
VGLRPRHASLNCANRAAAPAAWRCWLRCAGPRRVPLWLAWATPYHRLRACYIFSAVGDHILSEIRRLAGANGGRPPGRRAFAKRTGIRESAWFGIYWPRWGDALIEAGFAPNTPPERLDEGHVFSKLAAACRHFGRFPVTKEMRMYKKVDADFPNEKSVIAAVDRTFVLSPPRVVEFLHSQDPKRTELSSMTFLRIAARIRGTLSVRSHPV